MPPMVQCAKLGQQLPGLDESTAEGRNALRYALLVGGKALADRIHREISAQAWKQWIDHQVMVINEYRLDPMADESNAILKQHMEAFFFGEQEAVRNYVPPK
ncbi:MAG: oxidative damage protection protein [Planctomycetia bacterium]|nr:MAG: oxidative damage protection protein [Planctomycetia bacterium]